MTRLAYHKTYVNLLRTRRALGPEGPHETGAGVGSTRSCCGRHDANGRGRRRGRVGIAHHGVPLLPDEARVAPGGTPGDRRDVDASRRRAEGNGRAAGCGRTQLQRHDRRYRAAAADHAAAIARCQPGGARSASPASGRAIAWIAEGLEGVRDDFTEAQFRQLVVSIRATIGIEALVWLVDVAGLSRDDATALTRWSAQALLQRATSIAPPTPDTSTS